MKILIADDDPQIVRALRVTLRARGYDIVTATTGVEALEKAATERPDLYMIDLGMPALDGIDVITALRGWTGAPVLVVSGRTDSVDKVRALDAGADDYVTKPFAIDELLARIRALTRRNAAGDSSPVVHLGDIAIDLIAKTATRMDAGVDAGGGTDTAGAAVIRLTPTEWQILELLVRNEGKLVTRQTLLTDIWGATHVTDTGYLRLYISQLRKKLEPDPGNPRYLITEPGMGYRFESGNPVEHRPTEPE